MCLAVPGRVESIAGEDPALRSGTVDFAGVKREVSLAFTPDARIGDYVLVHVGFAIGTVDEQEARRIFDTLDELAKAEAIGSDSP
jgi:hydrogenase expression/formation protein HypC